MNKRKSGRFAEIMTGKGFYVILFLCIAAIGVSGYMLFFQGAAQTEKQAPLDYEEPADVWRYPDAEDYLDAEAALDRAVKPEIPVVPSPGQGGDDVPVAAMTAVPAPDASADEGSVPAATPASVSAPPSPSPAPKANIYVWPLKGDTVNAFSDTDLVYNKTMGDWRVHLGMDIAADMGAQVYSVADGKVADVYDDVFWGTTVVIDHGGGIGSRYSNMMKNPTVSVGDEVKAGQVIGGVGSTAEAERREVSHLHFAMEKDKKPIDPMQYLPVP